MFLFTSSLAGLALWRAKKLAEESSHKAGRQIQKQALSV